MIRLAIIYETDQIWVEIPPEDFKKSLIKYFNQTKSVDAAFEQIVDELRQKTRNK